MKLTFDDNGLHKKLAPLTLTRPVCDIRFGILTIRESWCKLLHVTAENCSFNTEPYLNCKFAAASSDQLVIAGNVKPTTELAHWVSTLGENEKLMVNGVWVASGSSNADKVIDRSISQFIHIENSWDIFQMAGDAIQIDFELLTAGKKSAPLSATNTLIGNQLFIEKGARVECSSINTNSGPVYITKNAEVMEGCMIRGPFALGESAVLKMGAKIYGPTSIGPHCKIGGEVTNCMFQAYSNKGHDGFLGNSVVGEWCNFGADTNSSNLKNNYSNVRIYSFDTGQMTDTNVQFCGVLMGDHSKTGINTMLNTATTVGVCANIFNAGFPPKYIPSFSWGGFGNERFILEKAFEVAKNMMGRRSVELTTDDKAILSHLYNSLA